MRYGRVFVEVFSMSLRNALAHRVNLMFELAVAVTNLAAGLGALGVIYSRTDQLAGWRAGDALILLGTFQMVSAVLATFIEPNFSWFKEKVRRGELDDHLLRPLPNVFLVSLQRFSPFALVQLPLGLALVVIGARDGDVTPAGALAWLALLTVACVIAWATRILVASLAFWAPYLEPSFLYQGAWQLARYPVGVYGRLSSVLTYVLPVAFISTIPAAALGGGVSPRSFLLGLAMAAGAVAAAVLAWRRGLRRYTSATS